MKTSITNRAFQLTALDSAGAVLFVTTSALIAGTVWPIFIWFDLIGIAFTVYVAPLIALLWLICAVFRRTRYAKAVPEFSVLGFVLPFI